MCDSKVSNLALGRQEQTQSSLQKGEAVTGHRFVREDLVV